MEAVRFPLGEDNRMRRRASIWVISSSPYAKARSPKSRRAGQASPAFRQIGESGSRGGKNFENQDERLIFPVTVCDAIHDTVHAYVHKLVQCRILFRSNPSFLSVVSYLCFGGIASGKKIKRKLLAASDFFLIYYEKQYAKLFT